MERAFSYRSLIQWRLRPIGGATDVFTSLLIVCHSGARLLFGIGVRSQVDFESPIFSMFGMTLHLTTGSSRSLRSLGPAEAGPLT